MRSLFRIATILLLIIAIPHLNSYAQELSDSASLWMFETEDGNTFIGSIVEEDGTLVILLTEMYGQVHIPVSQIKLRRELKKSNLVEGEHWFSNPHATRYFFMTNGYGLRKGEAYYQNTWIMFNQVNYGLTKNFSLGGGLVPLFLFAGAPTPVFLTPKVTIPIVKEKINVGAGGLFAHVLGEGVSFGIGYGALSVGNRDNNLTLGAGWAFLDSEWADSPTLTLSGMTRVGRKTYLLTENYYIGIEGFSLGILSFGGRSVQKRLAIDYGLFLPVGAEIGTFIAIPWLGIALPFGNIQQH
ncbi:MAG: hypothetical protein ABFS28_05570 [Bacteroidota bacterium]